MYNILLLTWTFRITARLDYKLKKKDGTSSHK